MDDFRVPSRPIQREGNPFDVSAGARAIQTPVETKVQAVPGVNPSLLGGAPTPFQPQPTQSLQANDFARDFTMPSPQTIAQEAAVVTESAEAVYANEPVAVDPLPIQAPSTFDIESIYEEQKPKNRLTGGRPWKKWAMSGGIVGLCMMIAGGGLLFAQGYNNAHKVFRGTGATAAVAAGEKVTLNGEAEGRVNILLMGNGGLGHEAPDLTDTLIVASIDTKNNTATMLSIPRDLWVQNAGTNPSKINASYELGKYNSVGKIDNTNKNTKAVMAGFSTADQVVEKVLGIDIHYNVLVNFSSFKQAVDAVGGVNVNVPELLYDPSVAWENGNDPVIAKAGQQAMDGKKALLYARSRQTSSDFARSQRQRSIVLALKDKALTAGTLSNPLKVSALVNAFGDNMVTDMTLAEGMRVYDLTKGIANSKVQNADFVTAPNNLVTTGSMGTASIALPRAGLFNYTDIQAYVKQLFNPPKPQTQGAGTTTTTAASNTPETAVITVLNGTTKAGLAGTKAAVIKAAGYNVAQITNAPSQSYAQTVIVDLSGGANPKTKQYLQTLYGVTAVAAVPDPAIQPGTANFIVILGSDQAR